MNSHKETVLQPRSGWKAIDLRELWQFRELLFFLTWRDVKIRYKQSLLGFLWAIIQPTMYMVVFTIIFGKMAKTPNVPYPIYSFSALILWTFFGGAIAQAGNSVVMSQELVTKVYLPRLSIPFASVGSALFDFMVAFCVLILMLFYYVTFSDADTTGITINSNLAYLPLLLFLTVLGALGVGTLLAALNVAFRDFKHTIPFLVQLWMFATPAIYLQVDAPAETSQVAVSQSASSNAQQESKPVGNDTKPDAVSSDTAQSVGSKPAGSSSWLRSFMKFNPMNGMVSGFRAAIIGTPMPWTDLAFASVIVIVMFFVGCFYFHRVEGNFADII